MGEGVCVCVCVSVCVKVCGCERVQGVNLFLYIVQYDAYELSFGS